MRILPNLRLAESSFAKAFILSLLFQLPYAGLAEDKVSAIPASQIGAEAQKQYRGEKISIQQEPGGIRLKALFQDLEGLATSEGLLMESRGREDGAGATRFRVVASEVGRDGGRMALPESGTVRMGDGSVLFAREGLTEEYRVSMDGVRQDFVLRERPAGEGALKVTLRVTGAVAENARYGAKLTLPSGREIAYSRLFASDAAGQELQAGISAHGGALVIEVDDRDAVYPVRIDPTFSDADWYSLGGVPGANDIVYATAVDGSGNLYIGGDFTVVGETQASRIAMWDGSTWSQVGAGLNNIVYSLAYSGGVLYVGGEFTAAVGGASNSLKRLATWNGTAFAQVGGAGVNQGFVREIMLDGTDIIIGGSFTTVASPAQTVNRIARWNGVAWSGFGSGFDNTVRALAKDSGGNIYAGGSFSQEVGGAANGLMRVAMWNGAAWSALGAGFNNIVRDLAIDGADTLYAGGEFSSLVGGAANSLTRVARWDGATWSTLGATAGLSNFVYTLAWDEAAETLYAGGAFTSTTGGVASSMRRVGRWSRASNTWSAMGIGTTPGPGVEDGNVWTLTLAAGGVYLGGDFTEADDWGYSRIAFWDSGTNEFSGLASGLNNVVNALAVNGTDVYLGGDFIRAGDIQASSIVKWDGSDFEALGAGLNGSVIVLLADGSDVYVGGTFTSTLGGPTNSLRNLARWDTVADAWNAVGLGVNSTVRSLAKDGMGNLYVGGAFTTVSLGPTIPASRVASWNGTSWSSMNIGFAGTVYALVLDSTDTLYAGGTFGWANAANSGDMGATVVNGVAKWNGSAWEALGTGADGADGANDLNALAVDSSDNVYAGGNFATMSGVANTARIAKWNGSAWSALGRGVSNEVNALLVFGNELYVAGSFTYADAPTSSTPGALTANRIARFNLNDNTWGLLGSGMNTGAIINALAVTGTDLYVGGSFVTAGGKVAGYAAYADINPPPVVNAGANGTVDEGSAFVQAGSFDDPGMDSWTATVNYGDGSGVQALTLDQMAKTFELNHTYADNGVYTITVVVTDSDLRDGSDTVQVTVSNVAPDFELGLPDPEFLAVGSGDFSRTVDFTDPGDDVWSGTANYGAGGGNVALSVDQMAKTFDLTATYTLGGLFTVSATLQDDDLGSHNDSMTVDVLLEPIPVTGAASGITAYSATLNGTVNPNHSQLRGATTAWFEYSRDPAMMEGIMQSSSVPVASTGNNPAAVPVSIEIADLLADEDYYFRMVAENEAGTTYGDIQSLHSRYPFATGDFMLADEGLLGGGELSRPIEGVINNAGRVSFKAAGKVGSGGITSSNDSLLLSDASGELKVIARESTTVEYQESPYIWSTLNGTFDDPILSETGETVFRDKILGTTTLKDQGYFISPDGEALEILSREGDAAPDAGTFTLHTGKPVMDSDGRVYFQGKVSGLTTKTDTGIWFEDIGTPLERLVAEGQDVSDALPSGIGWLGQLSGDIAAGGDGVGFIAALQHNPANSDEKTDTALNQAAFSCSSAGDLEVILRKGDLVDGAGVSKLTGIARGSSGDHAVLATLAAPATTADDLVLVYKGLSGVELVAREGVTVISGAATLASVSEFHVTTDGAVVFLGKVKGDGTTTVTDGVVCKWTSGGGVTLLAREGSTANGTGSNYGAIQALSVSPGGVVLVQATLTNGRVAALSDTGGTLDLLVQTTDTVTYNGSPLSVISLSIYKGTTGIGGGGGGMGAAINDSGDALIMISLGGGVHIARIYR